jgi:hypothetical protein
MTSGEGRHGDPQGQPPPWQPPGGPPSHWQRPGGPPPFGPPSYGPPGPPPPEPEERPLTVRAGLGAFMVSVVLSAASALFAWANWDEFVDQTLAEQPEFQDPQFQDVGIDQAAFAEMFATAFVVAGLFFTGLYLLFVWFAWRGYNWARIVLWVLGGLGIIGGLSTLGTLSAGSPLPSMTALSLFSFVAVLVGVVLLAAKPSNEWYAHEKWRRAVTGPR